MRVTEIDSCCSWLSWTFRLQFQISLDKRHLLTKHLVIWNSNAAKNIQNHWNTNTVNSLFDMKAIKKISEPIMSFFLVTNETRWRIVFLFSIVINRTINVTKSDVPLPHFGNKIRLIAVPNEKTSCNEILHLLQLNVITYIIYILHDCIRVYIL